MCNITRKSRVMVSAPLALVAASLLTVSVAGIQCPDALDGQLIRLSELSVDRTRPIDGPGPSSFVQYHDADKYIAAVHCSNTNDTSRWCQFNLDRHGYPFRDDDSSDCTVPAHVQTWTQTGRIRYFGRPPVLMQRNVTTGPASECASRLFRSVNGTWEDSVPYGECVIAAEASGFLTCKFKQHAAWGGFIVHVCPPKVPLPDPSL